ncbi:MAG: hypothetical protein WBO93_03905 [Gammaproteobacteria bacterium]|jgi:hypothetical protein
MFRASACLVFIVFIFPFAGTVAYLIVQTTGLSGLPGWLLGLAIFALILTGSIMIVSTINDRINGLSGLINDMHHRTRRHGSKGR